MAGSITDYSIISETGRKNIQMGVTLWDSKAENNDADALVGNNLPKDTQSFIRAVTFTAPGLPGQMDAAEAFPEAVYEQKDTRNYTAVKYGLKVRFTREVWKDNQYAEIMKNYGTDLRAAFHQKREILVTNNQFNYASTTSTTIDGVAYGSASHVLDDEAVEILGVSTASNIVSPAETVSHSLVVKMETILLNERTNKGMVSPKRGPYSVFCSHKRRAAWTQIKRTTTGEPGTTDNSYNYASRVIGDIYPLPYATHDDWTMFLASGARKQTGFIWDRESFDLSTLRRDDDNDTFVCDAIMRLTTGRVDYRGTAFSFAGA